MIRNGDIRMKLWALSIVIQFVVIFVYDYRQAQIWQVYNFTFFCNRAPSDLLDCTWSTFRTSQTLVSLFPALLPFVVCFCNSRVPNVLASCKCCRIYRASLHWHLVVRCSELTSHLAHVEQFPRRPTEKILDGEKCLGAEKSLLRLILVTGAGGTKKLDWKTLWK